VRKNTHFEDQNLCFGLFLKDRVSSCEASEASADDCYIVHLPRDYGGHAWVAEGEQARESSWIGMLKKVEE
jgi:hypothetical protein